MLSVQQGAPLRDDRIEPRWIEAVLRPCRATPGEAVCDMGEFRSCALNLDLADLAAWGDPAAHAVSAVSHVGWGLNGTALRVAAGNFLFPTGANGFANRCTDRPSDIPVFGCTIELEGEVIVKDGVPA